MLKKKLFGLVALAIWSLAPVSAQVMTPVSLQDALAIVQSKFPNQDVDYYLQKSKSENEWCFFLNADPLAENLHGCFTATIPKARNKNTSLFAIDPNISQCYSIPVGDLQAVVVKQRFDPNVDYRTHLPINPTAYDDNPMAERTYALIISGGGNPESNAFRYWNNCSFIYQTLVHRTQSATGITEAAWKGQETGSLSATGGILAPEKIDMIPAGEYRDIAFNWELPAHLIGTIADNDTERHHFCLLARVCDSPYGNDYDGDFSIFNVGTDNDVAQKNVSIVSNEELSKSTSVLIRNTGVDVADYSLEIRPRTPDDVRIFSDADHQTD